MADQPTASVTALTKEKFDDMIEQLDEDKDGQVTKVRAIACGGSSLSTSACIAACLDPPG